MSSQTFRSLPSSSLVRRAVRFRYGLWAAGLLLTYLLMSSGYWQATAVGPQIQVPMFYDAHYLFPRPWTQEQEAPGVPSPFPVAFYGPNTITQPFRAGADNLALLTVWLAGAAGTPVQVSLSAADGLSFAGEITLTQGEAGGYYRFRIPTMPEANGRFFQLTLSAPTATETQPVVTHVIGGDRLGGAVFLNEYQRPGNLELITYSRGWIGGWWLDALAEQILPELFRLRVQQYKPAPFKGAVFPALLLVTAGLSAAVLGLARPFPHSLSRVIGWGVVGCIIAFWGWQLADGRFLLPQPRPTTSLAAGPPLPLLANSDGYRIVNDMTAVLWTASREPEARFVSTEVVAGLPAVRVPADSRLGYALDVPLNGRFHTAVAAQGEGQLRFSVLFDGVLLAEEVVTAVPAPEAATVTWLEIDLTGLAGHSGTLTLATDPENGTPAGLWLMPQLLSLTDWLLPSLPDTAVPANETRFGTAVALAGYMIEPDVPQPGQPATITLYWRVRQTSPTAATVFVHVLNSDGELVAQHDSQPVLNSYPVTNWQPGVLIADPHPLVWPDNKGQPYQLGLGMYDPQTFARWPVLDAVGNRLPDDRLLLPLPGQP